MFYGWYIAVAGLLIIAFSSGVSLIGFSGFVNPIRATFGWSFTQVSLAVFIRSIQTGTLAPLMGALADRWPSRRLIFIGVIIFALGLFSLSKVTNLAMYYVSFLIMGIGASVTMLVPTVTVSRWFKRNITKATSVLYMGTGAGGFMAPVVVTLIDTYDWRKALIFLAGGFLILGLTLSLVFRTRPEEYGLLPDGQPQVALKSSSSSEAHDFSIGVKEALKTRAFWYIGIAHVLQLAPLVALVFHGIPYLTSVGIERSTAATIGMFYTIGFMPTRLMFGWLGDIFKKSYVIAVSIFLSSVSLFLYSLIDGDSSWGLIILFIIVYALSVGGILPLRAAIIREYFGAERFGTIFGLSHTFAMATAVGPPLVGWVVDTRGVYDPIWLIFSVVVLAGVVLMLIIPPPPKNARPV